MIHYVFKVDALLFSHVKYFVDHLGLFLVDAKIKIAKPKHAVKVVGAVGGQQLLFGQQLVGQLYIIYCRFVVVYSGFDVAFASFFFSNRLINSKFKLNQFRQYSPAKCEQIKHISVPNNWNVISTDAFVAIGVLIGPALRFICSNSATKSNQTYSL